VRSAADLAATDAGIHPESDVASDSESYATSYGKTDTATTSNGERCEDKTARPDTPLSSEQCADSIALKDASVCARWPGSSHVRSGSLLHGFSQLHDDQHAGPPPWESVRPPSCSNEVFVHKDLAWDQDLDPRNTSAACLTPSTRDDVRVQAEQLDEDSTVVQMESSRPQSLRSYCELQSAAPAYPIGYSSASAADDVL
jgi:hypothetical protein